MKSERRVLCPSVHACRSPARLCQVNLPAVPRQSCVPIWMQLSSICHRSAAGCSTTRMPPLLEQTTCAARRWLIADCDRPSARGAVARSRVSSERKRAAARRSKRYKVRRATFITIYHRPRHLSRRGYPVRILSPGCRAVDGSRRVSSRRHTQAESPGRPSTDPRRCRGRCREGLSRPCLSSLSSSCRVRLSSPSRQVEADCMRRGVEDWTSGGALSSSVEI